MPGPWIAVHGAMLCEGWIFQPLTFASRLIHVTLIVVCSTLHAFFWPYAIPSSNWTLFIKQLKPAIRLRCGLQFVHIRVCNLASPSPAPPEGCVQSSHTARRQNSPTRTLSTLIDFSKKKIGASPSMWRCGIPGTRSLLCRGFLHRGADP
jgi:hypothetical protein